MSNISRRKNSNPNPPIPKASMPDFSCYSCGQYIKNLLSLYEPNNTDVFLPKDKPIRELVKIIPHNTVSNYANSFWPSQYLSLEKLLELARNMPVFGLDLDIYKDHNTNYYLRHEINDQHSSFQFESKQKLNDIFSKIKSFLEQNDLKRPFFIFIENYISPKELSQKINEYFDGIALTQEEWDHFGSNITLSNIEETGKKIIFCYQNGITNQKFAGVKMNYNSELDDFKNTMIEPFHQISSEPISCPTPNQDQWGVKTAYPLPFSNVPKDLKKCNNVLLKVDNLDEIFFKPDPTFFENIKNNVLDIGTALGLAFLFYHITGRKEKNPNKIIETVLEITKFALLSFPGRVVYTTCVISKNQKDINKTESEIKTIIINFMQALLKETKNSCAQTGLNYLSHALNLNGSLISVNLILNPLLIFFQEYKNKENSWEDLFENTLFKSAQASTLGLVSIAENYEKYKKILNNSIFQPNEESLLRQLLWGSSKDKQRNPPIINV